MSGHSTTEGVSKRLEITEQRTKYWMKTICHMCAVIAVYEFNQDLFEIIECSEGLKKHFWGVHSFDEFILHHTAIIQEKWKEEYKRSFTFKNIENQLAKEQEVFLEYLQKEENEQYAWFTSRVFLSEWTDEKKEIIFVIAPEANKKVQRQREAGLKDALYLAEKSNKAKTEFLSNMSHDIRTPLNAVIGMTTIAKAYVGNKKKVEECLDKIIVSSKYLLALINDILDMSKIESGKMTLNCTVFSILEVVEDIKMVTSSQMEEKRQQFKVHIDENIEENYAGDVVRTKQILMNIIGNAVKFTPKEGVVYFSVTLIKRETETDYLQFEVQDTGVGMSEKFVKYVFEPFAREMEGSTRKPEGTGLGLPIARKLVRLLNGHISVYSKLGKGSTFTIELPFERVKAGKKNNLQPGKKKIKFVSEFSGEIRILVAEDNEINLEIITTLLEMNGFIIDSAQNGKEAFDKFRTSKDNYYSLIFMDIKMPVMDGLEATKRIRNLNKEDAKKIPIVAMTANAFTEDIFAAEKAGMDGYLVKPLEIQLVLEKIEEVLKINK